MSEMAKNWLQEKTEEVKVPQFRMKVDTKTMTITNETIQKKYSNATMANKRWIDKKNADENMTSYPYGIRHFEFADIPPEHRT